MIIPLDLLISYDENIYALTCAAIRRAYQVTVTGERESDETNPKVVSTAVSQILTNKVTFKHDED